MADELNPDAVRPCWSACRGMVHHAIALSLLIGACGLRRPRPRAAAASRARDSGSERRYPAAGRQLAGGWRPARLGGGALALRDLRNIECASARARRRRSAAADGRSPWCRATARWWTGSATAVTAARCRRSGRRASRKARRCCDESPPFVLVGFGDGDLTVRDAEGGGFLAGAAVSYNHPVVAGYLTAGCARL